MLDDKPALVRGDVQPSGDTRPLSRRETEVLGLAARGLTNVQIATCMHVTVHAVKFHLATVYRKLGVANRTQAAALYFRSGAALSESAD